MTHIYYIYVGYINWKIIKITFFSKILKQEHYVDLIILFDSVDTIYVVSFVTEGKDFELLTICRFYEFESKID